MFQRKYWLIDIQLIYEWGITDSGQSIFVEVDEIPQNNCSSSKIYVSSLFPQAHKLRMQGPYALAVCLIRKHFKCI